MSEAFSISWIFTGGIQGKPFFNGYHSNDCQGEKCLAYITSIFNAEPYCVISILNKCLLFEIYFLKCFQLFSFPWQQYQI